MDLIDVDNGYITPDGVAVSVAVELDSMRVLRITVERDTEGNVAYTVTHAIEDDVQTQHNEIVSISLGNWLDSRREITDELDRAMDLAIAEATEAWQTRGEA